MGTAYAIQRYRYILVQVGWFAEVGIQSGSGLDCKSGEHISIPAPLDILITGLPVDVIQFWNFKIEISAAAGDLARQWYISRCLLNLPFWFFCDLSENILQVVCGRCETRIPHGRSITSSWSSCLWCVPYVIVVRRTVVVLHVEFCSFLKCNDK
jgi:hypothetical protein